jgi:peptidyl-prolyl cis-trans isomerase C
MNFSFLLKTKKSIIFFVFIIFFIINPHFTSQAQELAKINGTVIDLDEFNKKYEKNYKLYNLNPPEKSQVLDDIIKQELVVQDFYNLKLDKDPYFKEKLNDFIFNLVIENKLAEQIRQIKLSDEIIKRDYEKSPLIRTSHIFIAIPPKADPLTERKSYLKMKQVEDEFLKGQQDFGAIARKHSNDPSAALGGDLDFRGRNDLDPVFYNAALALKTPGKVSGIIRTRSGYHLIKLTAIKPWEEVNQDLIKQRAFDEERKKLFNAYLQKLRDKATVIINPGLIQ